ncbi:MAG: hypothetical protein HDT30_03085 [Clostridiales bacterium]|nr:hypothetical protein [Clostridiales bacterium]
MKKREKRWIKLGILCSAVIILVLGFKIKDYRENPLWYDFKGRLMKENHLIKSISRSYPGPSYTIWIYFKNDKIDFDIVEPIFQTFLEELNQPEFVEELYTNYEKTHGQFATMDVSFSLNGKENSPFYYRFEIFLPPSDREAITNGTWSLISSTQEEYLHKKYRASDYK